MAESIAHCEPSRTLTLTTDDSDSASPLNVTAVRLKLQKPKRDKKVNWSEGTVDNEHLNKKKSKCCCIYQKPHSNLHSDDEDLDCENCRGHAKQQPHPPDHVCDPSSSTDSAP